MIKYTFLYCFLLTFILFSSCKKNEKLRFATSTKSATYLEVGKELKKVLNQTGQDTVEIISSDKMGSNYNCELLATRKAELALAQNDTELQSLKHLSFEYNHNNVRAILPLYSEILFIIYPDSIHQENLADLLKGRKVGLGPKNGGTASFMNKVFKHFSVDQSSFTPVYTSYQDNVLNDEIEISCALTSYNNDRIIKMLDNNQLRIFSFDKPSQTLEGSSVDGFCMHHTAVKPFIIPKLTYQKHPQTSVQTLAVEAILLSRSEVDKYTIYQITKSIYDHKHILASQNKLFSQLNENFQQSKLSFPLHEGAKMYYNRDKPSFIERYGRALGTIILAILTAISALYQWQVHRKKRKINAYYKLANKILAKSQNANEESKKDLLKEFNELEQKIYTQLQENKLDPSESFIILQDLLNNVKNNLRND